jgi:diacylglycerol kinase (ATP)
VSRPHVALIVNPTSGVGRAAKLSAPVLERLRRDTDVTLYAGTSAIESVSLVAAQVGQVDAVVVLGGDGMVHQALQSLAGTETPLAIIPGGTGNDSAECIGMPRDPLLAADAVIEALVANQTTAIDLGRTGGWRWWFTVLCAGFDSATNERANAMRWPKGPRRYDLALALETFKLAPREFTTTFDGHAQAFAATLIAVGNTPQYGGGKRMTPSASMVDGRFAITVVGPVSRLTLARLAPTLPRAGHIGHPAVSTYSASSVMLDAPATVAYADGERLQDLPVSTECIRGAVRVLVPSRLVPAHLAR